jgi:deoxyribodipyrimidine photo-lyase
LPTLEELGLSFTPIDPRAAIQFKGGETEALARLNHYFYETKIFLFTKKRETEWWAKIFFKILCLVVWAVFLKNNL